MYAKNSPAREFIIGTECGLLHGIHKAAPEKEILLHFRIHLLPEHENDQS